MSLLPFIQISLNRFILLTIGMALLFSLSYLGPIRQAYAAGDPSSCSLTSVTFNSNSQLVVVEQTAGSSKVTGTGSLWKAYAARMRLETSDGNGGYTDNVITGTNGGVTVTQKADGTITYQFPIEPGTDLTSLYLFAFSYGSDANTTDNDVCADSTDPTNNPQTVADLTAVSTAPPMGTDPTKVIPTDPCGDKTKVGADAYDQCVAKLKCDHQQNTSGAQGRNAGYILLPLFNNTCTDLVEFSVTLVRYLMMFAALIAGGMFAWGSFNILVSKGDPSAVADARGRLTNAAIGLILIAMAYIIVTFLSGAFATIPGAGVNLLPWSQ